MSQYLINKLSAEFDFTEEEKAILLKSKRSLSKEERKYFFQKLNPNRRTYREYLTEQYELIGPEEREKWYEITIESLLDKGGEADIVDEIALDIIGRIDIYGGLKDRAKKEGKPIKALAGGGGCLFFFTLCVMIVATVVLVFFR